MEAHFSTLNVTVPSIRFAEEGLTLASSLHAIMKIKWMYGQKIDDLRATREKIRRDLISIVSSFGQAYVQSRNLKLIFVAEWLVMKV